MAVYENDVLLHRKRGPDTHIDYPATRGENVLVNPPAGQAEWSNAQAYLDGLNAAAATAQQTADGAATAAATAQRTADGAATAAAAAQSTANSKADLTKALLYGDSNNANGFWDKSATIPTGTQQLNYSGYLRATRVYGMYFSDGADYAEAYAVEGGYEPGDLMAPGETGLKRNETADNPAVVGFVSSGPATLIGVRGESDVPIALSGRVPVKVEGTVRKGQFLSASHVPGAVKAAGAAAPRGAVVAMALEDKERPGVGLVSAFLLRL